MLISISSFGDEVVAADQTVVIDVKRLALAVRVEARRELDLKPPIFTDKYLKRLQATFPDATTAVLHGVGHFCQSDAPAEFSEAIETWWANVAGDGAAAS